MKSETVKHQPAHYPLVFPEVFTPAVPASTPLVGNPPFLGGSKLTAAFSSSYREHLVRVIVGGARGTADLIAYMSLAETWQLRTMTLVRWDDRDQHPRPG